VADQKSLAKKMPDLRNPALRYRDVNRVTDHRLLEVAWEPGVEVKNEWVYASLESESHRERLLTWLRSKKIPADADAAIRRGLAVFCQFMVEGKGQRSLGEAWQDDYESNTPARCTT
jgi:hypothetical protein